MALITTKTEIDKICKTISNEQLSNIESFVIFLGHAHSGHSIIGALLDAHPEVAISNEINIPKLILDHQLDKTNIFKLTLAYSLNSIQWKGEKNTGYKYGIKNSFQGKTKYPKILGDKKGGGSTRVLRMHPEIINQLFETFKDKLKIIIVLRNPKDNIAAYSYYWKQELALQHIQRYYENLETTLNIEKKYKDHCIKIQHSDFISNPFKIYKALLTFLNLKADDQMIQKWTSIVNNKENKRSNEINWPDELLKEINEQNIKFNMTGN